MSDNFTILIGGKVPDPPKIDNQPTNPTEELKPNNIDEINRQIVANNVLMNNWENCVYRDGPKKMTIKSCCSRQEEVVCYACLKIGTTLLTPILCSRCNFFKNKNTQES